MNSTSQVGRWQLFTLLCPGRRRLGLAANLQHMHGELSIVFTGAPILACAQYMAISDTFSLTHWR